jgi:hypothetical protein
VSGRRALRRIFGPVMEEVMETWRTYIMKLIMNFIPYRMLLR